MKSIGLVGVLRAAAMMVVCSVSAFAGGNDKVVCTHKSKELKGLSEGLYQKPGGYKASPKAEIKRAELGELVVSTPTEGLDATDSLYVQLVGYSGATGYHRSRQIVLAGQSATFDLAGPGAQDFTPNGKQQTLLARFDIEVTPQKRANARGMYRGTITIK